MVQIRAQKGLRAMADVSSKKREDCEASGYGAQGTDFSHPKKSERKGNAGRRPPPDGLPRIDGEALVP